MRPTATVRSTPTMRAGHREMRRAATMWAADGEMWGLPAMRATHREVRRAPAMRAGHREMRSTAAAARAGRGEMRGSGTMRPAMKSRTGSERRAATQRRFSPERASSGAGRCRTETPGSAVHGLAPAGARARRRGQRRDPRGIEAGSAGRVGIPDAAPMLGVVHPYIT